jgi:nucleotide-binding universal stress UspA family protein
MTIRTILVPLTLEDVPGNPAGQAAILARAFDAQIILLHVLKDETTRDAALAMLERPRPELDGLPVSRLLQEGEPAAQVLHIAHTRHADLIVMATDDRWRAGVGLSGQRIFRRFLLHSIVARILQDADCPVWTCPPRPPVPLRKLLCLVTLSPHDRKTLMLADAVAQAAGATLGLVHLVPPAELKIRGMNAQAREAWQKSYLNSLDINLARLQQSVGTNAEVVLENGTGPDALNDALKQSGADVLVAGHFPRHSAAEDGSDASDLIRQVSLPVLVAKEPGDFIVIRQGAARLARQKHGTGLANLVLLTIAAVVGGLLLFVAFYSATHPTGFCPPSDPACGVPLKKDRNQTL